MGDFAHVYDNDLLLKDAGLVAASAAATVGGSAAILDLGQAMWHGDLCIDFNAIEFDTADETYDILLQLSSKADFASDIVTKVSCPKGDARNAADVDQNDLGLEVIPCNNKVGDTIYRYARLYTVVGGTVATGINYAAWLAKR